MKRILSIFLAALFCISASLAAVTGVTAGEAADPDDNLVLHYDFEGATVEEKLKDKAPTTNNRVADDLKLINGTTDTDTGEYLGITFANGYVTQTSNLAKNSRSYLQQKATTTDDMDDAFDGEMTFTIRFRMNADTFSTSVDNDGYAYLFDLRQFGTSRPFKALIDSNKKILLGFAGSANPNTDAQATISIDDYDFNVSPWVTVVARVIKDSTGTKWTLQGYCKIDGDTEWRRGNISNKFEGENRAPVTAGGRIFTQASRTGVCIDDIKLYNRALTTDEIDSVTKVNAVRYGGFQDSAAYGETGAQKFDVRFVSTVNALDYRGVGMEVTRPDGTGTKTYTSTDTKTVYESLLGKTSANTPLREVAASEFDAKYLFCLTVTGVPTGEDVVFTVKPFAILSDGTKEYGDAYTVTFNADGTHKTAKIY